MLRFRDRIRTGVWLGERYRVGEVLEEGGMSVLFLGEDSRDDRPVVIKSVRQRGVRDQEKLARFRREMQAAGRLHHPHIVRVLDGGESESGLPFLVMERLRGHSLQEELKTLGALPVATALQWLLPIMGALAHAHDQGVIHRDIKPANIYLSEQGVGRIAPKLLDFGVSIVTDTTRLTGSGKVVGTVHYVAPEQVIGSEVSRRADVWGMGVVLFRCLSGTLPFQADDVAELLHLIAYEPAPLLVSRTSEAGPRICNAVDRALRKEPERRYPDMRRFAEALCHSARAEGVPLPESPDPVGLPDWPWWLSRRMPEDSTTADISSLEPPTPGEEAAPSAPPLVPGRAPARRDRTIAVVGLVAGVIALGAALFLVQLLLEFADGRSPGPREQRPPGELTETSPPAGDPGSPVNAGGTPSAGAGTEPASRRAGRTLPRGIESQADVLQSVDDDVPARGTRPAPEGRSVAKRAPRRPPSRSVTENRTGIAPPATAEDAPHGSDSKAPDSSTRAQGSPVEEISVDEF